VPRSRQPKAPAEADDAARCLAFINTLSARPTGDPSERLVSYEALVAWATEAGVLREAEGADLTTRSRRREAEAASVLARARDLRELLHAIVAAAGDGRVASAPTLSRLAEYLSGAYARARLVPDAGTLQWVYAGSDELDRVLWEIARAAARFVGSGSLRRVRACAASDCGWWFVDDTRNHSRRWCEMKTCGNREKLRRYRARHAG
jgi:predicted RNA-binding Zn ribbon-like protein